uniref:G_PROTEIN_RECEP_F3_4 domain-containing protein n=1 Tax=Elaeophora elaphi TaxID=1147741 RepID=A0A158Q8J1_9BILA
MKRIDKLFEAVIITLFVDCLTSAPSCSIYDPFRIQPDDNKYQIGAAFPLHDEDCVKLRAEAVQDIVAVQWALTHWNQNSKTGNLKTSLYAGDTCSKPKEAISQTLKFLYSLGFYEPDECSTGNQNFRQLLGLFLPSDAPSARAVASVLQTTPLPLLAYSYAVADELTQMNVSNFATTAPTLTVFIDAFIRLMKNLNSDLIAIVVRAEDEKLINRLLIRLRQKNIFISELIDPESPNFEQIIRNSDSQIIFTLLSKKEVRKLLAGKSFGIDKTWIVAELDKDTQQSERETSEFTINSDVQIIYLRQQQRDLPQFKNYFLRLLKNNHKSYSLLSSFMQQMCNCTISSENSDNDCSEIDIQTMALNYKQTSTAESIIKAVYAFTAVASRLEKKPVALSLCAKPSPECTELIMTELQSLIYEFDTNDPAELVGTTLHFYWESNTTLMSNGIVIEGIEMIDNEQLGLMEVKIMEYETGIKPRFAMITPQSKKIHSTCAPYHSYCGQCDFTANIDQKRFYLPSPRPHHLYIIGLFDFHGGRTCQSYRNSDISLPLAFFYTLTTFSQRYPQISLLRNLDIGTVLVDSCSSGRKAVEAVLLAENHCFTIEQGGQNITIVPGSVFGYASALSGRVGGALKGLFVSGDSLLVSLDADHDSSLDAISAIPSRKKEILALLKLLKKFSWEYISIVISDQDDSSMVTYRQFEKLAVENGICIAEVKAVNGEEVDPTTTANVTILFTSASDAATYFTAKLRREFLHPHVHIVNGDAHDFHLHDPSNVARFVGTLSLQPKDVIYDEFRTWLENITPLSLPEKWYWEYVENRWQCALSEANRNFYEGKMCTGDELLDLPSLGRMTKSGYFVRGLERFLFTLDAVYKRLCPEQVGVCDEFYVKGREQISKILKKAQIEHNFVVYEFMPDEQGSYAYQSIGNYSDKSGFKFSESYKYFGALDHISDESSQPKITSRCISPSCRCFLDVNSMRVPSSVIDEAGILAGSYIHRVPTNDAFQQFQFPSILDRLTAGQWRLQTWNYALAAIITVMLIGALGVLFLAIVKLYFRVIKGNQSLGLSLLVGVIVLYTTGYVFVFESTDIVCRLRIVLHPLGYAFCFGVMIAKATQLKNAESLGFSDAFHISYWNYWLLMLFIMGVQIALSSKWLTEDFASMVVLDGGHPRIVCKYSNDEFLLSQGYVIILLLLALCLNSTNKNIKRNHKETKWLFISSLSCAILWIIWMTVYVFIPPPYKDTVVVLELLLCASVLLGFIFGPKIYIMLSYEPVVVEVRPQNVMKDFVFDNDLFEKEENSKRISSPSNSLESRKSQTHSTCSVVNCKNASACTRADFSDDDQIPIFRTVMRKKNHLGRSHSADRQKSFSGIVRQKTTPSKMLRSDEKKKDDDKVEQHRVHQIR